jgi:hypothetical protein
MHPEQTNNRRFQVNLLPQSFTVKGKKMAKYLLLILVGIFISGCILSYPVYNRIEPYSKKEETTSGCRIGIEQESTTGSSMILIAKFTTITTSRLVYKSKYTLPPDPKGFEINPSQTWIAWGRREGGLIRIIVEGNNPYLGLEIFEDGSIPDQTMNDWKLRERQLPDKKLFEKILVPVDAGRMEGFKAELIYNGISKNTIKITYREYMNELARPAFYQELNYDLDKSNLIQFKTLKIKVLHADNSLIRFIILDDGGLPWVPK